jgi:hypothetical protein
MGLKTDEKRNRKRHYHQTTPNTRGADKSLARPTSPCILFDGENIFV